MGAARSAALALLALVAIAVAVYLVYTAAAAILGAWSHAGAVLDAQDYREAILELAKTFAELVRADIALFLAALAVAVVVCPIIGCGKGD